MMYWALAFLVAALVSAAMGFSEVVPLLATPCKTSFVVFLVLFILSLVTCPIERDI